MIKLKGEDKSKYISNPTYCPSCGSQKISIDPPIYYSLVGKQRCDAHCRDCGEQWMEIYTMVEVYCACKSKWVWWAEKPEYTGDPVFERELIPELIPDKTP